MRTAAPGTGALLASRTVPTIDPYNTWAAAGDGESRNTMTVSVNGHRPKRPSLRVICCSPLVAKPLPDIISAALLLVYRAAFHDELHTAERRDVLQRVAIDGDQIG